LYLNDSCAYVRLRYLIKNSTLEDLLSLEEIVKKITADGKLKDVLDQVAAAALKDFNRKPSRTSLYMLRLFSTNFSQPLLAQVFSGALGNLKVTAEACRLLKRSKLEWSKLKWSKEVARNYVLFMCERMVLECWQSNEACVYWFQALESLLNLAFDACPHQEAIQISTNLL
jgi:hypothetical protein